MTRYLVIPENETADTIVMSYRTNINTGEDELVAKLNSDGTKMTWTDVAKENNCVDVTTLKSNWCIENGIDGLGVCTEESGQETLSEKAARKEKEIEILLEESRKSKTETKIAALITKLEEKGLISSEEAVELRAIAEPVILPGNMVGMVGI